MSFGLDSYNKQYVYRCLRPNEKCDDGITAVLPNARIPIENHIQDGLKYPSQYISTTDSEYNAIRWGNKADLKTRKIYGNTRNTIVRIDVDYLKANCKGLTNRAYNFTRSDVRRRYLSTEKALNFAKAWSEVEFEGHIPKEAVSIKINGVWQAIAPNPPPQVPSIPMHANYPNRSYNVTTPSSNNLINSNPPPQAPMQANYPYRSSNVTTPSSNNLINSNPPPQAPMQANYPYRSYNVATPSSNNLINSNPPPQAPMQANFPNSSYNVDTLPAKLLVNTNLAPQAHSIARTDYLNHPYNDDAIPPAKHLVNTNPLPQAHSGRTDYLNRPYNDATSSTKLLFNTNPSTQMPNKRTDYLNRPYNDATPSTKLLLNTNPSPQAHSGLTDYLNRPYNDATSSTKLLFNTNPSPQAPSRRTDYLNRPFNDAAPAKDLVKPNPSTQMHSIARLADYPNFRYHNTNKIKTYTVVDITTLNQPTLTYDLESNASPVIPEDSTTTPKNGLQMFLCIACPLIYCILKRKQ